MIGSVELGAGESRALEEGAGDAAAGGPAWSLAAFSASRAAVRSRREVTSDALAGARLGSEREHTSCYQLVVYSSI